MAHAMQMMQTDISEARLLEMLAPRIGAVKARVANGEDVETSDINMLLLLFHNERLDALETRTDGLEGRLEGLEGRTDAVEVKLTELHNDLRVFAANTENRFTLQDEKFEIKLDAALKAQGADFGAALKAQGADFGAALKAQGAELSAKLDKQARQHTFTQIGIILALFSTLISAFFAFN